MRFSCIPLLAGLLAAQEPSRKPLLEVRTGADLVKNALIRFTPAEGELPEDGALHVTVDADGVLHIDVVEGDPGQLYLRADPGALLDRYREDIGVVLGLMRGMATMMMIQNGISSKEAMAFFEDLLAAPRQVVELELTAGRTGPGVFEADLILRPRPGTWFADVCARLRPLPDGAPVLREAEALSNLTIAVDPEVLPLLMQPFHAFSVALMTRDPEERDRLRSVLRRATEQLDGTVAMSVDRDNQRISQLVGIRDADSYRRLRGGADYELLLEHLTRGRALMKFQRMPESLRHRGIELTRSAMRLELGRLGVAEGVGDYPMLIYTGLVDDYELTLRFDPDYEEDGLERVRKLVDRTLDGQIRRMPLPDGALLRGELDLRPAREALETLLSTLGIRSDPPRGVTVEARRIEPGVQFHVRVLF